MFPRRSGGPRRTVVLNLSIDERRTKTMLKRCKSNGVSFSNALFALCNIAWAKTSDQKKRELPMYVTPSKFTVILLRPSFNRMMYSAVNLRSYLMANKALNDSYCYIAIGYFNVVLPSFVPRSGNLAPVFWHRARSAKAQSNDLAKNPMAVSRARAMAQARGSQARAWAKEDDDKARGVWVKPSPPASKPAERPPSVALLGLSLLGNLDGIYKHSTFGDIRLHTVTSCPRQRSGGMLMFSYTFVGKLWVCLGYDVNAFEEGVVERFWSNLLACTNEFLDNPGVVATAKL